MARISRIFCFLVAAALAASACSGPKVQPYTEAFMAVEDVCVMVGYKQMIDFTSGDIQFSVNDTKHIYRGGVTLSQRDENLGLDVQTVQHYFVLHTEEALTADALDVNGTLTLCSPVLASGMRTYKIEGASVIKAEDDRLWLWDDVQKLGVVVRLAE